MAWSERQLALLREMGLTLWWPGAAPRGAQARRRASAQDDAPPAGPPADEAAEPMAGGAAAAAAAAAAVASPAAASPGGPPFAASHAPRAPVIDAPPPLSAADAGPGRAPAAAQPAPREAGAAAPALSAREPAAAANAAPAAPGTRRGPAPDPAAAAPFPTGTRPPGIAQMDWPALREAVAGCTACDLCRGRTQTVFGVGNERAHWMIVGEAPGEQEDLQGEPFVGRSGQLLDRMLAAIGLTRAEAPPEQQVFIANTLKCRPPGNRNPQPAEMAQCEPYLLRQIELIQPRIILAMGRFAVQSLLRSEQPIGRLRGQVHRYHGVPLIVTYHPAYLLRNPADKALAWSDLCLARATLAEQAGPSR